MNYIIIILLINYAICDCPRVAQIKDQCHDCGCGSCSFAEGGNITISCLPGSEEGPYNDTCLGTWEIMRSHQMCKTITIALSVGLSISLLFIITLLGWIRYKRTHMTLHPFGVPPSARSIKSEPTDEADIETPLLNNDESYPSIPDEPLEWS